MSREFWIDEDHYKNGPPWPEGKQSIHVIEYSAFEKSQAQLTRALEALEKINEKCPPEAFAIGMLAAKALKDIKARGGGE
jgi:hypothetical protein